MSLRGNPERSVAEILASAISEVEGDRRVFIVRIGDRETCAYCAGDFRIYPGR